MMNFEIGFMQKQMKVVRFDLSPLAVTSAYQIWKWEPYLSKISRRSSKIHTNTELRKRCNIRLAGTKYRGKTLYIYFEDVTS